MNPFQYGLLRSQHSGLYLDVEGAGTNPGTAVCLWDRNASPNQIWYFDAVNSAIRTKLNDFALEYSEGHRYCVISPLNPNNPHQKWRFENGFIRNMMIASATLGLPGQTKERGSKVVSENFTGQHDQMWMFEPHEGMAPMPQGQQYQPPYPGYNPQMPPYNPQQPSYPPAGGCVPGGCVPLPNMDMSNTKREFVIKSEMDDKVLDIKGEDAREGASVVMYKPHRKKNQLWYLDQQGCIRSAFNGFVFYAKDKGSALKMVPFSEDPKKKWRVDGKKIMNGEGSCLDIRGGKCFDGAELCAYDFKGHSNQLWKIENN